MFSRQCDPPDHAVPEGEQPAPCPRHAAGGDHRVTQHRGQHRELRGRHQQRALGHGAAGHPVAEAARQDPHRPLRAGEAEQGLQQGPVEARRAVLSSPCASRPAAGRAGADRAAGAGCCPLPAEADGSHDHAEADPARAVHPPGKPSGQVLL